MERSAAAKASAVEQDYHSVTIVAGGRSCESARALRGYRLLAHNAPFLPLETCSDIEVCQCIYLHHDDRRHLDRRQDFLMSGVISEDRRMSRERRRDGTWRQSNTEPTTDEVKNAAVQLKILVERLVEGDDGVNLDDLYVSLDRLREDVECRVLLDSLITKSS